MSCATVAQSARRQGVLFTRRVADGQALVVVTRALPNGLVVVSDLRPPPLASWTITAAVVQLHAAASMDTQTITVQQRLRTTCIECESLSFFDLTDGDTGSEVARYACEDCDHVIRLDLDP